MNEQNTTTIIPPVGVTNDTLIGDLSSYFRWNNEAHTYQINLRIDPCISTDQWVECPARIFDSMSNPSRPMSLGELITHYNSVYRANLAREIEFEKFSQDAHDALKIISETIIQESLNRNWCSEFDDIIDEVNNKLPGDLALDTRMKEYEVSWIDIVTVMVPRSETVRAKDEKQAQELAGQQSECVESDQVLQAVREGSWDCDNYDQEMTVEEI